MGDPLGELKVFRGEDWSTGEEVGDPFLMGVNGSRVVGLTCVEAVCPMKAT